MKIGVGKESPINISLVPSPPINVSFETTSSRMKIGVGKESPINISLVPSPPINVSFETTYIGGGDSVASSQIRNIEPLTEYEYNRRIESGDIKDDTLYLILDE